ncbi:YfiT family bacillithiol transferase [Robiginitalea marina]|uniref:Bacillithiol transferase BstA n=1 Tax=Robiginitalea marina TaxID=2954105 RepID=A0ABT1AWS6_9FLAO|nr:bacillithiol transferase BstA [Robiginitalea marina]MCO5724062.1 bacillithiol transferase BstA [Robiginitalea marina]
MDFPSPDPLRYPIGKFHPPDSITREIQDAWISELEGLPARLSALVLPLDGHILETPYRPGGWTVRQVVHHLADSHHNSYMRFKWALTEDVPLIKVYDEKAWAALPDATQGPISLSLFHLEAVHSRLVYLLRELDAGQLLRRFRHPESGETTLLENIGRYAWHGNHHYAHIDNLLLSRGWKS